MGSGQGLNVGTGSGSSSSALVHYLCAENLKSFKEWTECIRPLCNPIQYNPFVCRPFMSNSSSSLSLSSSSSSSSPINTSLSRQITAEQNYRILRTLNVDIHEARNVCFSSKIKPSGEILTSPTLNNNLMHTHGVSLPKYHKDNMYYCLLMFNSDAIVASTRPTTCHNPPNGNNDADTVCKYSIWDDSFAFDNLPLDVKELKILLLVIAKPSNFSSSFVHNLKKLNNSNKLLDPMVLGSVNIRLDDLMNKGQIESWYAVEPAVYSKCDYELSECSIRIKIRFCEEKVFMDKNRYKALSSYLLDQSEHKNISILYEQVIPSTERSHFVQALLRFFIVKNKLIDMLKSFLQTDIDRCSDLATLFRPATCSTSLMDHYMRVRCEEFLHKVIEEPLVRIFAQNGHGCKSFELDPAKCSDANQREQNLFNFQVALKELINSICNQNSIDLFPNELKHIFYLIKQNVHLKWIEEENTTSDDKLIRVYCVSAFVFLRLLCPALLNPKNFGLKFFSNRHLYKAKNTDFNYCDIAHQFSVFSPAFIFTLSPSSSSLIPNSNSSLSLFNQSSHQVNCFNVSSLLAGSSSSSNSSAVQNTSFYDRHIKLMAKVLQTLANMTECKEPFMMPLSDFLSSNKPNIIKFIEDISSLSEFELDYIELSDMEDGDGDDSSEHETRFGQIKTQFENASCKYLAILNRLLCSFIPQMKSYVQKLDTTEINGDQETSRLVDSIERLIDILNDINR